MTQDHYIRSRENLLACFPDEHKEAARIIITEAEIFDETHNYKGLLCLLTDQLSNGFRYGNWPKYENERLIQAAN